jgi:hypothetical protein
MNFHATACGLIVSAFVICGGASAAPAPGANTSGLTVAISKIAVNQREMTLQFSMKNNSKGRAHVLIAVADRKMYGFLGSGEQLGSFPRVSGINACSSPLPNCSSMPYVRDLSHFGSIEPGDATAFSLIWTAQSPVSDKDTLSFTVPIVARFSSENGDPDQAGGAKALQFNFSGVHLDRDN